jgi:hypothetical protein
MESTDCVNTIFDLPQVSRSKLAAAQAGVLHSLSSKSADHSIYVETVDHPLAVLLAAIGN